MSKVHPRRPLRRYKDRVILDYVPKPDGGSVLGAGVMVHFMAVYAPGVPHEAAAAIGAVIGLIIRRLLPPALTYLNALLVPLLIVISPDAGTAIGEVDAGYLPTVVLIVGMAVAVWIAGVLYGRQPWRLSFPAIIQFRRFDGKGATQ